MTQVATTEKQADMFGILDSIAKVFKGTPIKAKDGTDAGMSMTLRPRKEIAAEFNLKGKDNKDALDADMLVQQDSGFRMAKSHIAGLNGEWTLTKLSSRTLSSGVRQITLVTREVKRGKHITDEDVSKAWNIPLSEVGAFRLKMAESAKEQASKQVDVETVVPPAKSAEELELDAAIAAEEAAKRENPELAAALE